MKKTGKKQTVIYGCILFIIIELSNIIAALITGSFLCSKPTALLLSTFIVVSIFEETVFRGIPLAIFEKRVSTLKGRIILIALTSLIFALFHLVNLSSGASLSYTLLQVFYAFCTGSFFCLICLDSGNIIIPVLMHILHDIITALNTPGLDGGIIYSPSLSLGDMLFPLIHSLIFIAFTAIFIDTKRGDVL